MVLKTLGLGIRIQSILLLFPSFEISELSFFLFPGAQFSFGWK